MIRNILLFVLIIIILIVVIGAGVLALPFLKQAANPQPTPSVTPTPTVTAYTESGAMATFSNASISMDYPKEWRFTDGGMFITFSSERPVAAADAEKDMRENVEINISTNKFNDIASISNNVISNIQNSLSTVKISNTKNITINNLSAVEFEWVNTEVAGAQLSSNLKFKTIVLTKNGLTYQITFTAAKQNYDSYLPTFDRMRDTLVIKTVL